MDDSLKQLRSAYDLTVDDYAQGIDPLAKVPAAFRASAAYTAYEAATANASINSGAPENKAFLNPQPGMRFLDAGCCANLANYSLHEWPSTYYGVDISPALIQAMRGYAAHNTIAVGGLEVAEVADLPYADQYFDIASMIGVLEYVDLDYCRRALTELRRVLKDGARLIIDIPNMAHPHADTMMQLEAYLGRPIIPKEHAAFEALLAPAFSIVQVDTSHVMLKYFLEC